MYGNIYLKGSLKYWYKSLLNTVITKMVYKIMLKWFCFQNTQVFLSTVINLNNTIFDIFKSGLEFMKCFDFV